MEEITVDVLVAGGGLAGLMAATRAALCGARVALIGGSPGASNHISGFATALEESPQDSPEFLFNDILFAGGLINNPGLVAAMVNRIGPETRFLEELGVPFQRQDGRLARRQAAGSTWPRAVYSLGMVGADACKALRRSLSADDRVCILPGTLLLDICTNDNGVCGGLVYNPTAKRWHVVKAPAIVLATGDAGRLFRYTTNPPGSRGTGYALALESGAGLVDMEFVSFEPFVPAAPPQVRGFEVLPTTVLREGARLLNGRGEEFLDTSQAPSKDIICRAMMTEVMEGRGTPSGAVYYDLRGMAPEVVMSYSALRRLLRILGLSPAEAVIEVMPVEHHVMGGAPVDEHAAASVPGLFAAGDVAGGVHGAHRLATCGGTSAIAIGAIAGEGAARYAVGKPARACVKLTRPKTELLPDDLSAADRDRLAVIRASLDRACGILRDGNSLRAAVNDLRAVHEDLRRAGRLKSFVGRALMIALSMASAALARTESRGDHFRVDHPRRDDQRWLGNILVRLDSTSTDVELAYQRAGIATRISAQLPTD